MKTPVITFATEQGPRTYQEDFAVHFRIKTPHMRGWLLAVMDGHKGKSVAELCANEIKGLFQPSDPNTIEIALRDVVAALNTKTAHLNEGSTLSIACILENHNKAVIAVLGDSPILVLDKHGELHMSPEHNVRSNSNERKAATKRGATYDGGYIYFFDGDHGPQYGLQLSRVLGDAPLAKILSREPKIYTIVDPKWVLVASDGLLDPSHKDTKVLIHELKTRAKQYATADELLRWASERGLRDNATALVWCRQKKR